MIAPVRVSAARVSAALMLGALVTVSGPSVVAAQGTPGAADAIAVQPSVDLPPDLDRVLRDYERHWSVGEAAELAALFVEDGLIVHRGTWIRGRDAIEARYAQIASGPLRLRAVEFGTDGEAGFIVGAYGYGPGAAERDAGLFVLTLERGADGRWLIVSDMDRGGG